MEKALQREQTKDRVKRYRERRKSVTLEGVTSESVTTARPIIHALADPDKRLKLRKICQSLSDHKVLDEAYYGCGRDPVPMSEVSRLLTAFD